MTNEKREVFLVFGICENDVNTFAESLAKKEEMNWLSENDYVEKMISENNYHSLCQSKWRHPLARTSVIEMVATATSVKNTLPMVISSTSLGFDIEMEDGIVDILNKEGVTVYEYPVRSSLGNVILDCLNNRTYNLKDSVIAWDKFERRYSRSFLPKGNTKAIYISGDIALNLTNEQELMFYALYNEGYSVLAHFQKDQDISKFKKKDFITPLITQETFVKYFYNYVSSRYEVSSIWTDNPDDVFFLRKTGITITTTCNQFAIDTEVLCS